MDSAPIMPISELSAYLGRWTIKAKVTQKAQMRTFRRGGAGAEGQVFHVELADAAGGEIRASFFNNAATTFFEKLQTGKVYTFSRGAVKVANKQYNNTNHRYEITFEKDAQIVEATGVIEDIAVKFNFVDLRAVQNKNLPCRVDLCGIITQARGVQTVQTKDGRELLKRDITLADDTATSVEVTLWGDKAKRPDSEFEGNPVVAIKSVLLKEWNGGRSGSTIESSVVNIKPEGPEAARLQRWWSEGGGSTASLHSLKGGGGAGRNLEHVSITQMRQRSELVGDQPQSYAVTARVAYVQMRKQGEQQPLTFIACAENRENQYGTFTCNRRVDESGFCALCNRAGKTNIRLNARVKFADCADGCWLTTFHEAAEEALGLSAAKVAEIDGENFAGREQLEATLRQRFFLEPLQLRVRAKLDTYQGESRPNVSCVGAAVVNRREHGRKMLGEIQEMIKA